MVADPSDCSIGYAIKTSFFCWDGQYLIPLIAWLDYQSTMAKNNKQDTAEALVSFKYDLKPVRGTYWLLQQKPLTEDFIRLKTPDGGWSERISCIVVYLVNNKFLILNYLNGVGEIFSSSSSVVIVISRLLPGSVLSLSAWLVLIVQDYWYMRIWMRFVAGAGSTYDLYLMELLKSVYLIYLITSFNVFPFFYDSNRNYQRRVGSAWGKKQQATRLWLQWFLKYWSTFWAWPTLSAGWSSKVFVVQVSNSAFYATAGR